MRRAEFQLGGAAAIELHCPVGATIAAGQHDPRMAYGPALFGVNKFHGGPFTRVGKESVSVEVTSVVRASDSSFQVRWIERRFVNGSAAGLERWTAVISLVLQPPRTEEKLRRNPLGIYVNGLSWSRELDTAEGAKKP